LCYNNILFKYITKQCAFWDAWKFQSRKFAFIATSYIQDDIMIVFTMALKCVLKILKTYVNFTGLQEENYFCRRKMFTCRKLIVVETLLPVSILFQLNENTNIRTGNSEHHTHTLTHIIYIIIFGKSYWNFWGIFRLRYAKLQVAILQWFVSLS